MQQQQQQQKRQRRRGPPPAAAESATSESSSSSLAPDLAGYRSFKLECCEFLVSEAPDGALDLRDVFVITEVEVARLPDAEEEDEVGVAPPEDPQDLEARMLVPPEVERTTERAAGGGELPLGPLHFQEVPWYSEYQGNVLEGRDPKRWVWRMYLVALASREPRQLDLRRVWVLDGRSRSVGRVDVLWLAPPDTPTASLRLRITRDGTVTVDTLQSIPSWEAVVRRYLDGQRAPSHIEVQRYEAGLDPLGGGSGATAATAVAAAGGDSSSGSEDGSIDLAEPPVDEEALLGDADEENLRDFVEEWGDEDEDAFDADLSG